MADLLKNRLNKHHKKEAIESPLNCTVLFRLKRLFFENTQL